MKKITMDNKFSIIATRAEAAQFGSAIKSISSTELQPFVGANYIDGKLVGGRTMTQMQVDNLLKTCGERGFSIEEISSI